MLWLNSLVAVLMLITTAEACSFKFIKILSDFSNEQDVKFFRSTLPWIVENIGSKLRISYHFRNQVNNTGIKECILMQMKGNTYLQATFLSLEAQEVPTNKAISNLPINDRKMAYCLKRRIKYIMKTATREFKNVKYENTPIIILPGKRKISQVSPETILKEICALFGKRQSERCINPTPYPKQSKPIDISPKTEKPTELLPQNTTHINDKTPSTVTTEINIKGTVTENEASTSPQEGVVVSNISTLPTTNKDSSTTPIETDTNMSSQNGNISSEKMTEKYGKVSESTSSKEADTTTLPTTKGDMETFSTE
ncbi:unnamed protein product [Parnassius apollo]|uniref:(apollo) hypothetical protein n=1 Tax=Parnassius apollo TaxID=110799 RepID=A0A8S3W4H9_PARAO|nr:unnamed protein product [Parnassius apollo]